MTVTIAVVDDDVRILDAIEMVLAEEGWAVRTYVTGETFLNGLEHDGAPQCLILDPHLPGISGAEVACAIIDGDPGRDVPIIGISARPSSAVSHQLISAGAQVMLMKPVAAEELVAQVYATLRSSGGTK